ncbi:MAG: DUF4214 domain-containing protein, partial [Actinobacteria bacterium]|nr:DUF4214 domain-containing protein [Actinomycetota bacterium]
GFKAGGTEVFRVNAGHAPNTQAGVFSTPVAVDLNHDGQMEIIATSWDQYLHAWKLNGQEAPGFPFFFGDTSWSSVAVGDIDHDGWPEIVFGFDCDGVPGQLCTNQFHNRGGYITVLRHDGTVQPGWPRFYPQQVIWSSPALADLNGDGKLDIVIGTGTNDWPAPGGDPAGPGNQVLAFTVDSGGLHYLPGWPVTTAGRVFASPAIADLKGNGQLDVVIETEGGWTDAYAPDGTRLWHTCTRDTGVACAAGVQTHNSPVVADVNNDGVPDVIAMDEHYMRILNGVTGAIESPDQGSIPSTGGINAPGAPATIASIGGQVWIVQNSLRDANGNGLRDNPDVDQVNVWTTGTALGAAPWPTFHGTSARTGLQPLTSAQVARLTSFVGKAYQDILGRAADSSGQAYLLGKLEFGTPRSTIANILATSDESRTRLINQVYQAFLGRPADSAGLNYWLGQMRAGMTIENLKTNFVGSPEYFTVAGGNNSAFVDRVYHDLVNRAPDPSGKNYWVGLLNGGAPRGAVSAALVMSTEALALVVNGWYTAYLGRNGDPGGIAYTVGLIQNYGFRDENIIATIIGSVEYFTDLP